MRGSLFADLPSAAKQGADLLFQSAVRRLYETVTGEKAKGDPLRLLERLLQDDHLTPEAALHLLSWARILSDAGVFRVATVVSILDWRDRVETLGHRIFA